MSTRTNIRMPALVFAAATGLVLTACPAAAGDSGRGMNFFAGSQARQVPTASQDCLTAAYWANYRAGYQPTQAAALARSSCKRPPGSGKRSQ
jgi:hypothetical protein